MVRKAKLCYNCLRDDHWFQSCQSSRHCKRCGGKHNSMLHEDRPEKKATTSAEKTVTSNHICTEYSRGILMTILCYVIDSNGVKRFCRVFVDSGSQANFMSEACVTRLGLVRESSRVNVKAFGEKKLGVSRGVVKTTLHSTQGHGQHSMILQMHIMNRLTGLMPNIKCKHEGWEHLDGLLLADPKWYEPGPIDIIIGVTAYHKVLLSRRIEGPHDNAPVAWETIFGWAVAGACPDKVDDKAIQSYNITIDPIQEQLQRFWEVEEPPKRRFLTTDERKCEEHFQTTYFRDKSGRFNVSIPFDERKKTTLGRSREIAVKRLQQVERRLQRNPALAKQYADFMQEYESLGHMSRVSQDLVGETVGKTNYLCHHFVTNEDSSTTKLRVVFDGSAATTTGVSLNDTMLVGATLQDHLYDILLRFRLWAVVLKGDIAKMFRQFRLSQDDANFHRILWRESPQGQIVEYSLNTVTYGTACATNLSTRCVQQLGNDCAELFPDASKVLLNDTFVDDVFGGGNSSEEVITLFHQLINAVATAGLDLRKFSSNSKEVMEAIPESLRESSQLVFDEENDLVKTLGIQWHPQTDDIRFKKVVFQNKIPTTKRSLLSELSSVFDPLGLISCVTLRGKFLLQELWKLPVGWDDMVPESTQERWNEYKADLEYLKDLSIPRRITVPGAARMEIHGFCDSSESGLGGIVYLRSIGHDGSVEVRFVTSKTKVAPVRQVTLPRLELCAAVLLAELVIHVRESLKLDVDIYLWSDSTITLTWIAASPRRWKTFVANRVATIQELTPISSWRHVAGVENPADLASRGCTVEELTKSSFWWQGPQWLSCTTLPQFSEPAIPHEDLEERLVQVAVNVAIIDKPDVLLRFSTLTKLKRLTAWFIRYLQHRALKRGPTGPLKPIELHSAFLLWVRKVQQQYFPVEMESLRRNHQVGSKSKLKTLSPFIDNTGILRVSGRLRNAKIPESKKHQVILPADSHLTTLLIEHYHHRNFHGGFQLTWSSLQTEFWIIRGRDKVRQFVRNCVRCRRYRAQVVEQMMGNLPEPRVTPSRPFLHCGVDYAGPFHFKDVVGRVPKVYKGYICLFVCLSTKAIHMEAASSLSTEVFLAALRRFVARRGLCAHMYSDCGTNFVGADRELQGFVSSKQVQEAATREMADKGILWHFNPPAAPHRGGLWEAGVKSAKHHLRRVLGNSPLTFEQFTTLLAQVEAVLNSRPLYARSPDPGDLEPLTPGHFLVGTPLTAVPDMSCVEVPANRLSHFQRLQQQLQHFWQRWSQEYLNTLQQRNKWMWDKDGVKVGDLVLLVEEAPPGTWKMGRILEVHPGADNKIRLVTVKTATTILQRVTAKLIPLIYSEN